MMRGTVMFVLHSHIPYVRKHGKFPFGEEWVYEALLDTYLPLYEMLIDLDAKGLKAGITLGITPILAHQLKDAHMVQEFICYAKQRIAFCEQDYQKFKANNQLELANLADSYCQRYQSLLRLFLDDLQRDIVAGFSSLQKKNLIEIITSAYTHGYLPLLNRQKSVKLQLGLGVESYVNQFEREPRGIWLPECAYKPGLDNYLHELGLKYFITDAHAIIGGHPLGPSSYNRPTNFSTFSAPRPYTTFQPYKLSSGVTALGRNVTTGDQVWSADLGYPGEGAYREFHRRDSDTGMQYWRVTDKSLPLHQREVYKPNLAHSMVKEHATHFNTVIEHLFQDYWSKDGVAGHILSPYDAELFGHWWHEGIMWLSEAIQLLNNNSSVELSTVSSYLEKNPPQETIDLPECSWGAGGKHQVWLNENTKWVWGLIHQAEDSLWNSSPEDLSLSNPLVREFLLLTSSDWPFLITTGQAKEYARDRILLHWKQFNDNVRLLKEGAQSIKK